MRNRAISYLRTQQRQLEFRETARREELAEGRGDRREPAAIELLQAMDLEGALARALGELTPRGREVFVLSRQGGLPTAQIAAVLGISPNTVEIHMTRALATLREKLASYLKT